VPRAFAGRLDEIAGDPGVAARWLYANQSRERRYHTANRIFLLLADPEAPDEAWRLRADVDAVRASIAGFMARRRFVEVRVPDPAGDGRPVQTAVIPVLRLPGPRQPKMLLPPQLGVHGASSPNLADRAGSAGVAFLIEGPTTSGRCNGAVPGRQECETNPTSSGHIPHERADLTPCPPSRRGKGEPTREV